jgi:serine/threonine-protein kinase MRCK
LIALVGSGKERHVRLIPTAALDGRDLKWIKVAETRGCHLLCWGEGTLNRPGGREHFFAVAVQKNVLLFQINRSERRHARMREYAMPGHPQCLKIAQGRLFVGYPSSFRVVDMVDHSQICESLIKEIGKKSHTNSILQLTALVNLEDGSLQFLNQTLHDAEMAISVWHRDESTDDQQQQIEAAATQQQLAQMNDERPREYLLIFQKLGIYVDAHGLLICGL